MWINYLSVAMLFLVLILSLIRAVQARREYNRKSSVNKKERHPKQAIYSSLMRSARLSALHHGHNIGKSIVHRYPGGHIMGSAMCRGCGSVLVVDTTTELATGTALTEGCESPSTDKESGSDEEEDL